jgi:deoxyribodipyrimidine photo-lyase
VVLQHPWALGATPAEAPADALVLGLLLSECHQRHPWSDRRWRFVLDGWEQMGVSAWWAEAAELRRALAPAASVWVLDDPHLRPWRAALPLHTHWLTQEPLFAEVSEHCASFSRWWQRTHLR